MTCRSRLLRANNHSGASAVSAFFRYTAGDSLATATFTRASTATYFDSNGVLQTASSGTVRDGHYISGVRCLLLEASRTNVVLWNRDLTNAAWTKSNVTAAKDQTGIDGSANSASSITATSANGTCLQAITLGSSARYQSAYVKRLTGSGTIQMTMDNGSTWTNVTVTASWTQVTIPTQTLANPTVGFRIVTSGDAIAVDYVQNENGTSQTSVIATTTAAVTRAAEKFTFPWPYAPAALTFYMKAIEIGFGGGFPQTWSIGTTAGAPRILGQRDSTTLYEGLLQTAAGNSSPSASSTYGLGNTVEARYFLSAAGSLAFGMSQNSGTEVVSGAGTARALDATWGATPVLALNSDVVGGNVGLLAVVSIKVALGVQSLSVMRAA